MSRKLLRTTLLSLKPSFDEDLAGQVVQVVRWLVHHVGSAATAQLNLLQNAERDRNIHVVPQNLALQDKRVAAVKRDSQRNELGNVLLPIVV